MKLFVRRHQQTHQSIQPVNEINHEVDCSTNIVDWLVLRLERWTLEPEIPGLAEIPGSSPRWGVHFNKTKYIMTGK